MADSAYFRANVGVVVCDGRGQVLTLQRKGQPGSWQFPQGGLDAGEEPRRAALRELEEETGLGPDDVELLAEHPSWLAYELPPKLRSGRIGMGQAQKWFLVRLRDPDRAIDLRQAADDEFDDHKWTTLDAATAEVWSIKRSVYEAMATTFRDLVEQ